MNTASLIRDPLAVPPIDFDATSIDPNELDAFVAERSSHRVGRYFESLVLFWLERIRKVEIVAHGQQIREGNRTIGEIDFLFRDESGRLNHWEAAVKFFLHFPRENDSHFPGPNANDNFERKAGKLLDKQLPLSEEHFPEVEVRRAFVRGIIFYHATTGEPTDFPNRLANDHQRGGWIRCSELNVLRQIDATNLAVLPKPWWLAHPLPNSDSSVEATLIKLESHFSQSDFPVMVSVLNASEEVCRMFVVADSWPY